MTASLIPSQKVTLFYVDGTCNLFDVAGVGLPLPPVIMLNDIGNALDPNNFNVVRINYSQALLPIQQSVNEGCAVLRAAIAATPGPFMLCGYSQGAMICSLVFMDDLRNAAGSLHGRRKDLKAAAMFGNPCREEGATNEVDGYPDPGGHGAFSAHLLTDTPSWWWEFCTAAPNKDIVASMSESDPTERNLMILLNYFYQNLNTRDLLPFIIESLSSLVGMTISDPMAIFNMVVAFANWVLGGGHAFYPFAQAVLGNSKTPHQLAIDHFSQRAELYQRMQTAVVPQAVYAYWDRWHLWVEDIHGTILTKDLIPQDLTVVRTLSGPSQIEFKVHYNEPSVQMPNGSGPINFKPYGHLIHAVKENLTHNEIIWATGIFQPSDVDPDTGVLSARCTGFSDYATKLPWLENWNPIAVDPFEIVSRIWAHIQSYPMGNLGVTVYPTASGTQMLPGFSFQNENFIQDFFAIFIRETDRNDCGDYINKLARDIPFDYWEQSVWNPDTRKVDKSIRLAYPYGGVDQQGIIFRLGENVSAATQKLESEMDWFSDITMQGYFPGKEYSVTLSNADPDRLRRVMDERDLNINSNERSAAWAHRRLTRIQAPRYFESVFVEPYHPNAPFGSYDVGDLIRYQGPMHWHGNVNQKHKVMMMIWDEAKDQLELKTKAEGQFNYDPIVYSGGQ